MEQLATINGGYGAVNDNVLGFQAQDTSSGPPQFSPIDSKSMMVGRATVMTGNYPNTVVSVGIAGSPFMSDSAVIGSSLKAFARYSCADMMAS